MLRTRILTAAVLLALLVGAALLSHAALAALCAAFVGLTLFEWLRLSGVAAAAAAAAALACAAAAWVLEWLGRGPDADLLAALCLPACLAWAGIGVLLTRAQRGAVRLARPVLVAAAALLCAAAWFALLALLRVGEIWTLSVLALVWLADSAAYFAGRTFGRRKLASRISPGKTWEGVWGAFLAVLGLAEAVRWIWPGAQFWSTRLLQAAPLGGLLLLALLVALSIVGDLFESLVKRQAGQKDSGRVFPGHGGAWDRLDACLPVLPLAVLVQALLLQRVPGTMALALGMLGPVAQGWDAR
jgi:phosphatidate cytidylyltransferase